MPRWRVISIIALGFVTVVVLAIVLNARDNGSSNTEKTSRPESATASTTVPGSAAPAETAVDLGTDRPALGVGSVGEDVTVLQLRLIELGFDPGGADGQYGQGTAVAVSAFQTSVGLDADGVVGPATWAALAAGK